MFQGSAAVGALAAAAPERVQGKSLNSRSCLRYGLILLFLYHQTTAPTATDNNQGISQHTIEHTTTPARQHVMK